MMGKTKNNSGYIALVSVISISLIISVIVFTLNLKGFFSRFSILDSEFKEISLTYAMSCRDIALYKLKVNGEYEPKAEGDTVLISSPSEGETCLIKEIKKENDNWVIKTVGVRGKAYTNLEIVIAKSGENLVILSSKEVSNAD